MMLGANDWRSQKSRLHPGWNIRNNHSQCVRNVLRNLNLIWSPRLHQQEAVRILTPYRNKYTDGNGWKAIGNRKTPTIRGFQKSLKKSFFGIVWVYFFNRSAAPTLLVCVCAQQLGLFHSQCMRCELLVEDRKRRRHFFSEQTLWTGGFVFSGKHRPFIINN